MGACCLTKSGWVGGDLGQAVTAGAENTSSHPRWPHLGCRSGSKGWGGAAHVKDPMIASHELYSKPVRKEVLPHLVGRAPQMGVSASAPKMGPPVTPDQILSPLPASYCLDSQGRVQGVGPQPSPCHPEMLRPRSLAFPPFFCLFH